MHVADAKPQGGETALLQAADGCHAECVRMLLAAGADMDAIAPSVRCCFQCFVHMSMKSILARVFCNAFYKTDILYVWLLAE